MMPSFRLISINQAAGVTGANGRKARAAWCKTCRDGNTIRQRASEFRQCAGAGGLRAGGFMNYEVRFAFQKKRGYPDEKPSM